MSLRRGLLGALGLVWVAGLALGGWEIYRYQTTAGAQHGSPASWPEDSSVPRPEHGPTLVMFVDPGCPCSRASLAELGEIVKRADVAPRVVFIGDEGPPVAHAVPVVDRDGSEAKRFGATTSGHVVVYAEDGTLAYAGGVTGERGHAGDNAGRREVLRALADDRPGAVRNDRPVFGCDL